MSKRPRRNHTPAFKARVAVLAAIKKGDRTLAQLAEQFDVHPNQITSWKAQLEEGAADVFGPGGGSGTEPAVDVKSLHAKIGETDAGERFFGRSARQSRFVERKAMIDPAHDLSITNQAEALNISRGSVDTICHVRCRTPTSRSCGVSTGCIWSSLSRARGCCKACWSLRGTRSAGVT